MKLTLQTAVLDCEISIRDKYCFISGFSGQGKSLFIQELADSINTESESLSCSLPLVVVNTVSELSLLDKANRSFVLACDEFLAHDVLMAIQNTECYAICVTRKVYKDVNYSDRCLYSAVRREDGKTVIRSNVCLPSNQCVTQIDTIVTEDSAAGYEFMTQLFPNARVVSAGSKQNVVSVLRKEYSENGTLLCCDRGGIGSIYNRLFPQIVKRANLLVLLPECFEHVLLCSGFIKFPLDILSIFRVKDNNTEAFCEKAVTEYTNGKPFEYSHSKNKLSLCWVIDCADCAHECEFKMSDSKLRGVLENGPYSKLLEVLEYDVEKENSGNMIDVLKQLDTKG